MAAIVSAAFRNRITASVNDAVVGNFGDGEINAYCLDGEGQFHHQGTLRQDRKTLVIDGLWGIGFGNNAGAGSPNVLYFAAGPDEETNGYVGKVEFAP